MRISANDTGTGLWMVRYTFNSKRRELIIGSYGRNNGELTFAEATSQAIKIKSELKDGIDPAAEKKRLASNGILIFFDTYKIDLRKNKQIVAIRSFHMINSEISKENLKETIK